MSRAVLDAVSFEQVWRALGGGPLVGRRDHQRGRAFWRDGNALSVAVDVSTKVWKDHVTGEGGGLLALVCTVRNVDHAAAWSFLSDLSGVPLARFSPSEAARYRAAVKSTQAEAKQLWDAWAASYDAVREYTDICFQYYHALRDHFWNDPNLSEVDRAEIKQDIAEAWSKYSELRRREESIVKADPGVLVRLLKRTGHGRAA